MRGSDTYRGSRGARSYQSVSVDATEVEKLLNDMDYQKLAQKAIKKEIRLALRETRKATVAKLKSIVGRTGEKSQMGDPRGTYRAVKTSVYRGGGKTSDGGNISILNKKGEAKTMMLWKPKKGGKSGITRRRYVSKRTKQINSYQGADRAFILRFLDRGTETRTTEGTVSLLEKWHRKQGWKPTRNGANRGKIKAGNFFGTIAREKLEEEGIKLSTRIYKLIEEVAN